MAVHTFVFVLEKPPADHQLAQIFNQHNVDMCFGTEAGLPVAEFDREAPTLPDAVASAYHDLELAGLHALRFLNMDDLTAAYIEETTE